MRGLKVVAVLNTKGGVGKTVLARSLAVQAAKASKRFTPLVAVIDLDPQKTLEGWWDLRSNVKSSPTVLVDGHAVRNPDLMRDDNLEDAIEKLERRGYNYLIVDTPPAFLQELEVAAGCADFVVIPTRPDIENMKASRDAIVITRRAIDNRFMVVINAAPPRSPQEHATRNTLAEAGLPVAKQTIWQRVSHSRAADQGKTAGEIDDEAAAEIESLWAEVKAQLLKAEKSGHGE